MDTKKESPHYKCKWLTIHLQHGVQEAISFILQSIVGSQWYREVTIDLFVTYKHLNICKKQKMEMFSHSQVTQFQIKRLMWNVSLRIPAIRAEKANTMMSSKAQLYFGCGGWKTRSLDASFLRSIRKVEWTMGTAKQPFRARFLMGK